MLASHYKLLLTIFIAGILMVTFREVYSRLSESSYQKVAETISVERADELVKLLQFDLNRIGLGVKKGEAAIIEAKKDKIIFKSDFDEDGIVETVKYYLSDMDAASSTQNPNDKILYRIVDNEPAIDVPMGVTRFELNYFDSPEGKLATNVNDIRTIEATIVVQNTFSANDQYTSYTRHFRASPPNLLIR